MPRINKDGTRNKQDWSIQDHERLNLTAQERALWQFRQWASLRPKMRYYDALPPAAQIAVDAVEEVARKIEQ